MVEANVVPQLVEAIASTVTGLMQNSDGDRVAHTLARPYEQKSAQYDRTTEPTLILEVGSLSMHEDPQNLNDLVVLVPVTVTVRQKLIDETSAGYRQLTYYRLWDIAEYLAGRLHRSRLLSAQVGLLDVKEIEATPLAQEDIGVAEIVVRMSARLVIPPLRELNTTEDFVDGFRRPFVPIPAEDAPEITGVEVEGTWR